MAEKHRKRKRKFSLSLSEDEFDMLTAKAKQSGMTKTAFVRRLVLEGNAGGPERMDKEDVKQWLFEINKIGTNINQVVYQINAFKSIGGNDFLRLQEQYKKLLGLYENFALGE